MTIAKGRPWGAEVDRPEHVATATSDAELSGFVTADPGAPVAVSGGDVFTALGRPARTGSVARRLPMDALRISTDGGDFVAVAHVVLRNRWWPGPLLAIMNVGRLGRWDVAPAGHPNDGRAEVVEVDAAMALRTRLQVRRRLPTGTHLPHPQIRVRSRAEGTIRLDRPLGCWVDGVRRSRVQRVAFSVDADAYALIC